ncbi:sensor histidine kinase [Roseateles albus]|uniref:histidine kinase n=1 Tax=Roseateles albus TaxID=2987525 RepID=A0ABT5KG21_9BURK|nr:sensor histidine kinase [Roseateles albus]MDC8772867.1 sensor histidine kinase [Roseateles albus]
MRRLTSSLKRVSLRTRLLATLGLWLTLVLVLALLLDLRGAERLADQAFDQALLNNAVALAARVEIDSDNDLDMDLPQSAQALLQADPLDTLFFAVFDGEAKLVWGDPRLAAFVSAQPPAKDVSLLGQLDGQAVRVLTLHRQGPAKRASIVVAETLNKRLETSAQIRARSERLGLLLLAAAMLGLYLSTRRILQPLERFASQIEARQARDLSPVEAPGDTSESAVLAAALNSLLARLRESAAAQREFIGDTAHQLRTPLASLSLQIEMAIEDLAVDSAAPAAQGKRLQLMQSLVARLQRLVQRILSLERARSEAGSGLPAQRIDLPLLVEDCAAEFIDRAERSGIDLGFELAPAAIEGWAGELHELLSNLIDNALTHGRSPIVVRTRTTSAAVLLEVEDQGTQLDVALLPELFQRHRRGAASQGEGLGLFIVKTIADHHGATVSLLPGKGGLGLLARVSFSKPDEEQKHKAAGLPLQGRAR